MTKTNKNTGVPRDFHNYANAAASGANDYGGRTARRLIVGSGGEVWLMPIDGGAEKLFALNLPAGFVITQQHLGIGASTAATDLTAQF